MKLFVVDDTITGKSYLDDIIGVIIIPSVAPSEYNDNVSLRHSHIVSLHFKEAGVLQIEN